MRMLGNSTRILGGAVILSVTLSAQTFTILYSFGSQEYDGTGPQSGLILGPQRELYGTTGLGGRWGRGAVYELLPPPLAGGAWTEAVLHSFSDADGGEPLWGLARGANGSLYGVTSHFAFNAFKLDPPTGASTHWPYTVIYQFNGNSSGPLVFGPLPGYGQSLYGSASGIVFRLTPPSTAGDAWTQTILYTFPGGSLGSGPAGSLAVGAGGGLFGVTTDGGYVGGECFYVGGCGTVFSLTPPAQPGGLWSEEILHAFKPWIGEGALPAAGLVMGLAGVQYGTTGAGDGLGASGIFSLTPPVAPGVPMTETTLYDFGGVQDLPATVLPGPNGVLYGTASGGSGTYGAVFELVPPAQAGGRWTETILHSFTGGADGGVPNGLTLAPDGTLYGTTLGGGTNGVGTVFALTP